MQDNVYESSTVMDNCMESSTQNNEGKGRKLKKRKCIFGKRKLAGPNKGQKKPHYKENYEEKPMNIEDEGSEVRNSRNLCSSSTKENGNDVSQTKKTEKPSSNGSKGKKQKENASIKTEPEPEAERNIWTLRSASKMIPHILQQHEDEMNKEKLKGQSPKMRGKHISKNEKAKNDKQLDVKEEVKGRLCNVKNRNNAAKF